MAGNSSTPQLISRQEAIAQGLTRYFTGEACKQGHVAERRVNKSTCLACEEERRTQRAESLRPYFREHYARNRERVRAAQNADRAARPEHYRALYAVIRERYEWYNPEKVKANSRINTGRRRARQQTHLPEYRAEFMAFMLACPSGMTVDHIVPLGRKARTAEGYPICGLHVPWNLQYLTQKQNEKKGNRMQPRDQALCEATTPQSNGNRHTA